MTPFRQHQDVAVVEHDDAGKPLEHGQVLYATVTEVRPLSARALFGDGDEWLFLLDSRDRAWREAGRWRLVPVCRFCDMPVMGTPHADPSDPLHRLYCGEERSDADDEAAQEQHCPSGVAT